MIRDKRKIKKIVLNILEKDDKARSNDKYLLVSVVDYINPALNKMPFEQAINHKDMPCIESVRRSRAFWQAKFPRLKPNSTVQAMRDLQEEEYRTEYVTR